MSAIETISHLIKLSENFFGGQGEYAFQLKSGLSCI